MSGIVGIVHFDGAPVDRTLLRRMTNFMSFRGPDEQRVWVDGNAGFGHALLRATEESGRESQPFTLDGQMWIVADARVDAQADLIRELAARGEHVDQGVTDVELLLRAYGTWGEECVEHLLGDFAFAVWDGPRRRLFCARDHFGVKPLFYAQVGHTVIFSTTLDCIRQHPAVSAKLNDLAIADFLLFDLNQDPATTSFAGIQRVPPAHRAAWSARGLRMSRYWTLPIDEPVYFKRLDDYTDRFKELLDMAVSDRLRTDQVAIFMSGGLDSPALAATACKILRSRSSNGELHAFTTVIDGPGSERYYAGLVAEQLGVPIHFLDRSAQMIDPDWNESAIHTPEPVANPMNLMVDREEYRTISAYSRVLFYGEGPDNALHDERKPGLSHLARSRTLGPLAADVCGHRVRHRHIPLLPTFGRLLKDRAHNDRWRLAFPNWLNPSFESRLQLRDRWEEQESSSPLSPHPLRPVGYGSFHTPRWEALFKSLDAEEMAVPLKVRHPFLDLRLLRYMLAVPAMPWCKEKYLERRAMRGLLPDSVLWRPKLSLTSDPAWEGMRSLGLPPFSPMQELSEYVNSERVPVDVGTDMVLFRVNFRPLALNYWLQNLRPASRGLITEDWENEFAPKAKTNTI